MSAEVIESNRKRILDLTQRIVAIETFIEKLIAKPTVPPDADENDGDGDPTVEDPTTRDEQDTQPDETPEDGEQTGSEDEGTEGGVQ